METVAYAYDRSMSVLLFTNGTTMISDLANFLFDHDVSFVVKKYAMDHQKHDYLLGKPGMRVVMQNGLKTLTVGATGSTPAYGKDQEFMENLCA